MVAIFLLVAAVAGAQSRPDTSEIQDDGRFQGFTEEGIWRRVGTGDRLLHLLERVEGRRPEIRSDFDVHLVDGALIYVREACGPADVAAPFFLHLEPVDPDDLPVPRRPHGFDNLDFRFHVTGVTFRRACLARVWLPAYDVAAIRTGQYVETEDGVHGRWEGEIRPGPDGVGRVEIARSADPPLGNVAASRIEFLDGGSLHEPVLWYGGRFQFMDVCPERGCLAVQFGTDGEVAHAWPLRSDALEQASNDADDLRNLPPTGRPNPPLWYSRFDPIGISQYPNGDLLVVFHRNSLFQFAMARIDGHGFPVWFRHDGSHHWPVIEDDGTALVPGRSFGQGPISVPLGGEDRTFTLECDRWPGIALDRVNVIDGDGRLLDSIDLMGAMLDSPFAHLLVDGTRCTPFHLNFVHRIVGDAGAAWGMSSGDLVASMRSKNAFAILDAASGRVKRLVRGTFRGQHSVHHFEGSRFLLFDNTGATDGSSRLLMVDLADGSETTVFPNDDTPEALRGLFTRFAGKTSISPDRRRAIVVFTNEGVAVEVRLSDGAVLKVFRSLHDVSGLERFREERAARFAVFQMMGLDYVHAGHSPW